MQYCLMPGTCGKGPVCEILWHMQVVGERDKLPHRPPLLVKIAPDLSAQDKADIAAVVLRQKVREGRKGDHLKTNPK